MHHSDGRQSHARLTLRVVHERRVARHRSIPVLRWISTKTASTMDDRKAARERLRVAPATTPACLWLTASPFAHEERKPRRSCVDAARPAVGPGASTRRRGITLGEVFARMPADVVLSLAVSQVLRRPQSASPGAAGRLPCRSSFCTAARLDSNSLFDTNREFAARGLRLSLELSAFPDHHRHRVDRDLMG
jgi:hypothetical protein